MKIKKFDYRVDESINGGEINLFWPCAAMFALKEIFEKFQAIGTDLKFLGDYRNTKSLKLHIKKLFQIRM